MQPELHPSDFAGWREHWDMPLADGLVEATSVHDWQRLLDMIHSSSTWRVDWHGAAVHDAHRLLAGHRTFDVWLTPRTVVTLFPNGPDEVLLDLDVRTVDDAAAASAVSGFLRTLGELLSRDVVLTYEGLPDKPMARYSRSDDAFLILG